MRDAIEGMNGHSLDSRNITVNEAQSAETVEAVAAEVDTAVVEAPKLKKTL